MNPNVTKILVAGCIVAAAIATIPALAQSAAKELRHVRGTAGYQVDKTAEFKPLFGRIILSDEAFAITRAASNADVVLPDSSEVALGALTTIQVGAFNNAAAATPTTITVNNGAIRFAIRHPAGGRSNYRFSTPTSQTAVRGTIALMDSSANGDVYVCLDCTPQDFVTTVTSTGQNIALLTGQTLAISPAGVASVTTTTPADLAPFTAAGLNAGTVSLAGFAPGIEDRARTGSSGGNGATGVNAGGIIAGAAAAAAIGIVSSNTGSPAPSSPPFNPTVGNFPTPTPTPSPVPTTAPTTTPTNAPTTGPTPAPTSTPSTAPITVITNGGKRATPSPAAPAATPANEPPTGIGGGRLRGGH